MKNKIFRAGMSIIMVAVFLFGITLTAGASPEDDSERTPQTVLAKIYSDHFGVTLEEANHRLNLQGTFPDLGPELEINEPETYAGVWIQHEPEYKIVVAFTEDGEKTLGKYCDYIPVTIAPYIEIRTVEKSYAELLADQDNFYSFLKSQDLRVDSCVDIRNNYVSIDVATKDIDSYNSIISNNKNMVPDNLLVNYVENLASVQTEIYGGLTIKLGAQEYCTTGFAVVEGGTGTKGVLTAGHALNDNLNYNGYDLPYQNGLYVDSWDFQWHTAPGLDVEGKFQWWSDNSTFPVESTRPRASQYVGDVVSKYGKTTDYTAGEISSISAIGSGPCDEATFIKVENVFGYARLSDQGDSGCPWFTGTVALGVHHGGSGGGTYAYYMAIDYISILNVSVIID